MKTLSLLPLASVMIAVVGMIPAASAGNPSPRQVEENPALVRPSAGIRQGKCKLCVLDANTAFWRSPRVVEENPALARAATCAAEVPVKVRGVFIATGTPNWPRTLETR